ncbi:SCO family protein [Altericroceibacterium endophyticum]|uniref:Redoxin domain-containing protein n=1 Tax=Altericroceibacterium endophyticum TaxID=1808508 RepID=A0A6I4T7U8_9SPHN|nr:SCO family protein [Altericroceibacterium endophyticum]MXO65930.1 redoxin domain-containing protein [Altericroceibacterium endophyticum]
MNRHAMIKTLFKSLAAACLAATLTACSAASDQAAAQDPPLEGARIGGPFTLTDKDGNEVKWSDFDGKYRMVYFGYAYCPDVCPLDVQRMMQGYKGFAKSHPDLAKQVQPIFITIDPERDTPAVVGEFAAAFSDDLLGLTGTAEQVKKAADAFSVYYQKGEVRDDGSYLMDHSRGAYLMGREGEPIALLPVDQGGPQVAEELEKWVH